MKNTFGFSSAYFNVNGKEPMYTSIVPRFPYCIDYIFISSQLRATNVLDVVPIPVERLVENPSPSDHLPLAAVIEILSS